MNLFELFVKIGVKDEASKNLSSITQKIGNGLKTAAKIGTAAVGAAAAGITALTTAAVNNYAEYEQLVGGVETLFKGSADKVQEYAANAYKTAGMSANEYMSTVTSFSASLLQSLGGDTDKAAEYANQALTDMSDNANKMGTSMEMIQNAYQGFAKQNYTMLDNLKLGYGGTKEEMARLIKDAAKLDKSIDANDMSFANIVKSINAVQTEMGITGTTALEAGRTISGSVGAMKSAWTNLVTGFADGNADIESLIDDLVTTIVGDGTESNLGVFGNIMPAIETALTGAATLIEKLFPEIMMRIPAIITDNLPIIVTAAVGIVQSLIDGISENQGILATTAIETMAYMINSLVSMLPKIVSLGLDLIVSLSNGIAANIPKLFPTIVDTILQIVNTLTNKEQLNTLLDAALVLVLELARGIVEAIPQLVDAALQLVNNLIDFILNEENLNSIIDAALEIILVITEGLVKAIPQLVDAAIQIIEKLCEFLLNPENISMLIDMAFRIVVAIVEGLGMALVELVKGANQLVGKIVDIFKETDWKQIGKNIVDGLINGLKNTWSSLTKWFSNAWDNLVGGVKDLLGIHSPSRVFAGIGKNMALGVGEGFGKEFDGVKGDIESAMHFETATIPLNSTQDMSYSTAYKKYSGSGSVGMGGDIVLNVTEQIDGATLARNTYRYNAKENKLRGESLVEVGAMA